MRNRREFFTTLLKPKSEGFTPLPPYILDYSLVFKFCALCVAQFQERNKQTPCVQVCDEVYKQENKRGILKIKENKVCIEFEQSGCKLCGECAKACPHNVLDEGLAKAQNPHWNFAIRISEIACLAYQKTLCCVCKDVCYSVLGRQNAILFSGLFYPQIQANCIGCGECISVCPTNAIVLESKADL
ncbi:4Fe-4S binding protein [Helicobacter sp. MIT 05-5294]|uniref:4Fe-4S binding protein n=1 Tax=Helicobacter sp. MIT 05-5294 TaxID=1548150 RepID=UPI00051FC4FC|nr:4Fe-4S binding protein [Helicobacter sp. MIT 05-5294]TLD86995.1 nitrate reductase [Helicobacter sp. MIT 05-5294]